ncbi:Chromosomal replication initiator protein DnaA [Frankliniella fusca]|uniref:Chromosomal replication initiator protein DnaA n=1 Tax=Frankliniella fusca TaxID=407009 RepID=A0AAE1H3A5_9NEOP|nr:Chromosomal replication initiator protein DnaA [Frankliniella fusca]
MSVHSEAKGCHMSEISGKSVKCQDVKVLSGNDLDIERKVSGKLASTLNDKVSRGARTLLPRRGASIPAVAVLERQSGMSGILILSAAEALQASPCSDGPPVPPSPTPTPTPAPALPTQLLLNPGLGSAPTITLAAPSPTSRMSLKFAYG